MNFKKILAKITLTIAILSGVAGYAGTVTQTNDMVFNGRVSLNRNATGGVDAVSYTVMDQYFTNDLQYITNAPPVGRSYLASDGTNGPYLWVAPSAFYTPYSNAEAAAVTITPYNGAQQVWYQAGTTLCDVANIPASSQGWTVEVQGQWLSNVVFNTSTWFRLGVNFRLTNTYHEGETASLIFIGHPNSSNVTLEAINPP